MRPPKSIRPLLPPYASCEICGEHRLAALRTRPINGRVLCIRCTSKKRPKPGHCSWCELKERSSTGSSSLGRKAASGPRQGPRRDRYKPHLAPLRELPWLDFLLPAAVDGTARQQRDQWHYPRHSDGAGCRHVRYCRFYTTGCTDGQESDS